MKKAFKIVLILLLILSLVANFFLFKTFDNYYDKEKSRKNSNLIYSMVPNDILVELNQNLATKINMNSSSSNAFDTLLNDTFEQLWGIQAQLMEYSGGVTPQEGYFWTPIGKQYTENYFYTDNYPKHYAYKEIQKIFDKYLEEVKRITQKKKSYATLPSYILDKQQKNVSASLFKGMTVAEAVIAIEQMKSLMLLDKLKHQMNDVKSE